MKPYKDPDEFIKNLGAEAFQERIDNAMNSFMFELSVLEKNYNLKDPDGKTAFLNEAAKKLVEFKDEVERNNYIETVAGGYFVSKDSLSRLVAKQAGNIGLMAAVSRNQDGKQQVTGVENGSGRTSGREKDDGIKKSQRMLLTWLIEEPKLYKAVSKYINPSDFTEELYYKVALMLFDQFEKGELNPAKIISAFTDEEMHKEVARLFNTELPENMGNKDKQKALDEIVRRVKENSIDTQSRNISDIVKLQELITQKRALNTMHISIN